MSTEDINNSGHPWIWTLAGILSVLAVLYFIAHFSLTKYTRHNEEYEVPDFYGMQFDDARALATKNGFRLEVTDSVYSKVLPRGAIFRQNPSAGSMVKQGRRIILTINSVIQKKIEMPLLVGFSLRQARTELSAKGLQLEKLKYENDMATNNVLSQEYKGRPIAAGTLIPQDSKITLVVGQNPNDEKASVPDVIGYTYKMACDIVWDNSFNIEKCLFDDTVISYSDSLTASVYKQIPSPADSSVTTRGSGVTLYFTKDHTKVARPASQTENE
ncbi:MAG: PASTA domain-containing protein [Alistipes sp.]|nr:PASTA domain-containing protein [Candidatus Minthomonas equi]